MSRPLLFAPCLAPSVLAFSTPLLTLWCAPFAANKYADQKKASAAIRGAKNVTTGQASASGDAMRYSKSTSFFTAMQDPKRPTAAASTNTTAPSSHWKS